MFQRFGLKLARCVAIDVLSATASTSSAAPAISQRWLTVVRQDAEARPQIPVVYTDGACKFNGQAGAVGSIGVYWGPDSPHNVSKPLVDGPQTNIRAEMRAVSTAIDQAISLKYDRLIVRTDSKFVIDALTKWVPNWKQKGWKTKDGKDVKHRQDFEQILELMEKIDVEFEHVVGHTGIHGNEEANRLANEGVCKIVPVVYTAGVLTINEHGDSIGGIGVYWGVNDSRNIAQPLIGDQSLNRAKIQAICKALDKAISKKYGQVIVRTDSEYLFRSLKHGVSKWVDNGWKTTQGDEVKYRQDFEQIVELMKKVQMDIEYFPKQEGSSTGEQAEASQLAKEGATKIAKGGGRKKAASSHPPNEEGEKAVSSHSPKKVGPGRPPRRVGEAKDVSSHPPNEEEEKIAISSHSPKKAGPGRLSKDSRT